jgi:hypothetical protein
MALGQSSGDHGATGIGFDLSENSPAVAMAQQAVFA